MIPTAAKAPRRAFFMSSSCVRRPCVDRPRTGVVVTRLFEKLGLVRAIAKGRGVSGRPPSVLAALVTRGELLTAEHFEEGVKPDGPKPVVRVRGERAASKGPEDGASARLEALGQE